MTDATIVSEGSELCPVQSKGLQSPQQMKMTLTLLVQNISVCGPVQFIVEENTQVFVLSHNLNVKPWMFTGVVAIQRKSVTNSIVLVALM